MEKYKLYYDKGFPFETGHWDEWDVFEQHHFLRNLGNNLRANDSRAAKKLGLSHGDLDELDTQIAALKEAAMAKLAVIEGHILNAQIRGLLFEEIMLRTLHEKVPIDLSQMPSGRFTSNAEHNLDSLPRLAAEIEKFSKMSHRELIVAGWDEVISIRQNIGKDPYADEMFASRLSEVTAKLETALRSAEINQPSLKGN